MITSTHNRQVTLCRSLHKARGRREAKAFLVEGVRLSREAFDWGIEPLLILYERETLERTAPDLLALAERSGSSYEVAHRVIEAAADTRTPAGIVIVLPEPEAPEWKRIQEETLLLVLDGIADAGNAGTILRSAVAAGLNHVIFTGHGVDPFAAKTVRAGMGAHFRLGIREASWTELASCLELFEQILGADAAGSTSIYDIDWSPSTALVIGSEAHGLSSDARSNIQQTVRVPMARGIESLNASVVASVILFHAQRPVLG